MQSASNSASLAGASPSAFFFCSQVLRGGALASQSLVFFYPRERMVEHGSVPDPV